VDDMVDLPNDTDVAGGGGLAFLHHCPAVRNRNMDQGAVTGNDVVGLPDKMEVLHGEAS